MSITYGIIEETYVLCSKSRTSYGIAVYSDVEFDDTATVVAAVNDISCDRQKISALIEQCNRLALSPSHLNDVIEDFLTE